MAKITEITFEALVQTKQFENKRVAVRAVLDPKDDPAEVRAGLEVFVMEQLGRGVTEAEASAIMAKAAEVSAANKAKAVLKNVVTK
jgi:hypothetical protein